ncbi:MAG: hypothetical protein H7336_04925 [Bacteriovorax sp.]|nr:hypothetical protein [Bacteriovorax sp.]
MKKLITIFFIVLSFSAMAAVDCSFNFKDFHSMLEAKSKKYKSVKPESKDEISKTVTQQAKLKTGEDVLFVGGGCAHFSYSFNFSKVKFKTNKVQEQFKKAHDLLLYIDIQKGKKDILVTSLETAMKKPIQKSKTDLYDLKCGDALCNLDLSSKNSLKISYSFAL